MGLSIHLQPDAHRAAQLLSMEKQEAEQQLNDKQFVRNELDMGKLKMWVPDNYDKDRHLTVQEKLSLESLQGYLALKADIRDDQCWMHTLGCGNKANIWVHEVGFDLKELKARLDFAQANSADMTGPTPGFCMGHLATAPAMLAQAVYQHNILVQWGYLPTRWFAKFTDGTSVRGLIEEINPTLAQPEIIEQHITKE